MFWYSCEESSGIYFIKVCSDRYFRELLKKGNLSYLGYWCEKKLQAAVYKSSNVVSVKFTDEDEDEE
jgi:hypothetical protein